MPYEKLALILGDSLYPSHETLKPDPQTLFFMAEDFGLCTHFQYHKHKLVLFLSAMRSHAEEIRKEWPLVYHELTSDNTDLSYLTKLHRCVEEFQCQEIVTYEIEDHFFAEEIQHFCLEKGLRLTVIDSPGFLNTKEDFQAYNQKVRKPFMHTFYQQQRKRLNLLLDNHGEPLHGKWSFDEENRKKLPKGIQIPAQKEKPWTTHTQKIVKLVDALFPDHPGETKNFLWATTREEVLIDLDDFLEKRFENFGPYEDAIHQEKVFIFHSVLSPYLNLGLITPRELMERVIDHARDHQVHFPSVEGFVRQIIGWREFLRGIYHEKLQQNQLNHQKRMQDCWYDGTTGLPPLDDSIRKALKFGYTHHIERLMVLGNVMLLCEIHPDEVYRWFMEMYVDSADWVMAPNVYGMSQFSDGGIFATKPYIAGSNYLLKMSNYQKSGDWPEMMNGLYWRFIATHRELFLKNPRMSMMVRTLDKMDSDRKERLFDSAETFISKVTF